MRAIIKHDEAGGVMLFWQFCLAFALQDRGYNYGRIKQGMRAVQKQMERFDGYSCGSPLNKSDYRKLDDAVWMYQFDCGAREIDWERIQALEDIPAITNKNYAIRKTKAYWDMVAAVGLNQTYRMRADTLVEVLTAQRKHLRDIQSRLGATPKFRRSPTIWVADILKECVRMAESRELDWDDLFGVTLNIDGKCLNDSKLPVKGCTPFAAVAAPDVPLSMPSSRAKADWTLEKYIKGGKL